LGMRICLHFMQTSFNFHGAAHTSYKKAIAETTHVAAKFICPHHITQKRLVCVRPSARMLHDESIPKIRSSIEILAILR
jgi:hypothetical protein